MADKRRPRPRGRKSKLSAEKVSPGDDISDDESPSTRDKRPAAASNDSPKPKRAKHAHKAASSGHADKPTPPASSPQSDATEGESDDNLPNPQQGEYKTDKDGKPIIPMETEFFPKHRDLNRLAVLPDPHEYPVMDTPKSIKERKLKDGDNDPAAAAGLPRNWSWQNLGNYLTGARTPNWWPTEDDPFAFHQVKEEYYQGEIPSDVKAGWENAKVPGLSLYHVLRGEQASAGEVAAVLGFRSTAHCWMHMDTEDTLGKICLMKYHGWYLPLREGKDGKKTKRVGIKSWPEFFKWAVKMPADPTLRIIFTQMMQKASKRVYLFRVGDIMDRPAQTAEEKNEVHVYATMAGAIFKYLQRSTVSRTSKLRRYDFRPTSKDSDRVFGFTVDDWFRGTFALTQFMQRRGSQASLTGPLGNRAGMRPLMRVAPEQHGTQLTTEQHKAVYENFLARENLKIFNSVKTSVKESRQDKAARRRARKQVLATVHSRMYKRTAFLMRANPFKGVGRHEVGGRGNRQGRRRKVETDIPPLDQLSLQTLISSLYDNGNFELPVVSDVQARMDVAQTFAKMVDKSDLHAFMATQEAMVDTLAKEKVRKGADPAEAAQAATNAVRNCQALMSLAQKARPRKDRIEEAVEALGLTRKHPGPGQHSWDQWKLDPDAEKSFEYKPHQIIDAFHMWTLKRSPLRGSLLASDVGTGKTVVFLTVAIMEHRRLVRQASRGRPVEAWPTGLVCPATLVPQTFHEIHRRFPGVFNVKLLHGSSAMCGTDKTRAKATLTQNQFEVEAKLCVANKGNPENALRIFITSYSTAVKRWTTKRKVEVTVSQGDPVPNAWQFDAVVVRYSGARGGAGAPEQQMSDTVGGDDGDESDHTLEDEEMMLDMEGLDDSDGDSDEDTKHDTADEPDSAKKKRKKVVKQVVRKYEAIDLAFCSVEDFQFGRLVCDEAQLLRSRKSAFSRLVRLFPKNTLHLVSATPTLNHISDIRGFSHLLWSNMKLGFSFPDGMHAHEAVEHADLELEEGRTVWSPFNEDGTSDCFEDGTDPNVIRSLHGLAKNGQKFWYLHPKIQAFITRHQPHEYRDDAFRQTGMYTIRRGMDTPLTLPDGRVVFPRQDMPPHRVITEELSYKAESDYISDILQGVIADISSVPDQDDEGRFVQDAVEGDEDDARLSMSIVRALWMLSQCPNSFDMLKVDDAVSSSTLGDLENGLALMGEGEADGSTDRATLAKQLHPSKTGALQLGSQHVEHIARHTHDGGLAYMNAVLSRDPRFLPQSDRLNSLHFALCRSPLLTRMVDIALQNKLQGRRTLFMVNNPWIQQLFHAILIKASFKSISICAGDGAMERENMVAAWNDRSSLLDCCVLTMAMSSSGLNLHTECCQGVIAQFPWNVGTLVQAMGRLIRLGQKDEVLWRILRVNGTMFDFVEHRMCVKFVEQIRQDVRLPEGVDCPGLQRVISYEVMRVVLSQPFNRYSWVAHPPTSMQQYNESDARELGYFYSCLVRLVVSEPPPGELDMNDLFTKITHFPSIAGRRWLEVRGQPGFETVSWQTVMALSDWAVANQDEASLLVVNPEAILGSSRAREQKLNPKLLDEMRGQVRGMLADVAGPGDEDEDIKYFVPTSRQAAEANESISTALFGGDTISNAPLQHEGIDQPIRDEYEYVSDDSDPASASYDASSPVHKPRGDGDSNSDTDSSDDGTDSSDDDTDSSDDDDGGVGDQQHNIAGSDKGSSSSSADDGSQSPDPMMSMMMD